MKKNLDEFIIGQESFEESSSTLMLENQRELQGLRFGLEDVAKQNQEILDKIKSTKDRWQPVRLGQVVNLDRKLICDTFKETAQQWQKYTVNLASPTIRILRAMEFLHAWLKIIVLYYSIKNNNEDFITDISILLQALGDQQRLHADFIKQLKEVLWQLALFCEKYPLQEYENFYEIKTPQLKPISMMDAKDNEIKFTAFQLQALVVIENFLTLLALPEQQFTLTFPLEEKEWDPVFYALKKTKSDYDPENQSKLSAAANRSQDNETKDAKQSNQRMVPPFIKSRDLEIKYSVKKNQSIVLANVIQALLERPTSDSRHYEIYAQLPLPFKKTYWVIWRDLLPYYKEKGTLKLPLACELSHHIENIPDPSGYRAVYPKARAAWEQQLLDITYAGNSIPENITISWVNHLNGKIEQRILHPHIQQQWVDQKYIDANNAFLEKSPENETKENKEYKNQKNGRSRVFVIRDPQPPYKIIAYLKIYPEMPGLQNLAEGLMRRINKYFTLGTLCKITFNNKTYPVYISQAQGETLQDYIDRGSPLSDIEEKIDAKSFAFKVIETLLLSYEDDKWDNLALVFNRKSKVHFISFDSDRLLVDPLLTRRNGKEIKVNSKTAVFSFNQMQIPFNTEHREAFAIFNRLDPAAVLTDWLLEQDQLDHWYCGRMEAPGLFSQEEIASYFPIDPNSTEEKEQKQVGYNQKSMLLAAFEPGKIEKLYQCWLRLQDSIRAIINGEEGHPTNFLELISSIHPHWASFYQKTFIQYPVLENAPHRADKRFAALPTDYTVIEKIMYGLPTFILIPPTPNESASADLLESEEAAALAQAEEEKMQRLSAQANQPLLVKCGQQLTLYGYTETGWQSKPLDSKLSRLLNFPSESPGYLRLTQEQYQAIVQQQSAKKILHAKTPGFTQKRALQTLSLPPDSLSIQAAFTRNTTITPYKAAEMLCLLKTAYDTIDEVRQELREGSLKKFIDLKNNIYLREKIMSSIDISLLLEKLQKIRSSLITDFFKIGGYQNLHFQDCPTFTDDHLEIVIKNSPQLRHLTIINCPRITESALRYLPDCTPYLELLKLNQLPKISYLYQTIWGFESGSLRLAQLKQLNLRGCQNLKALNLQTTAAVDLDLRSCADLGSLNLQLVGDLSDHKESKAYSQVKFVVLKKKPGKELKFIYDLICLFCVGISVKKDLIQATGLYQSIPLGTCLETLSGGHKIGVKSLTELRGGDLASCGSYDNKIKIWRRRGEDGKYGCVETLSEDEEGVTCLTELRGGDLASGCGSHGGIKIWRRGGDGKYECVETLSVQGWIVRCLTELRGGGFATGLGDVIKIWRRGARGYECVETLSGHGDSVDCLTELRGGDLASGCGSHGGIEIWRRGDGKYECVETLSVQGWIVRCLTELRGRGFATGLGDVINIWRRGARGYECVEMLRGHGGSVDCLAELRGGDLVSGASDHKIKIWRRGASGYECVETLSGHEGGVTCLTELRGGELVSGSDDNTLKLWHVAKVVMEQEAQERAQIEQKRGDLSLLNANPDHFNAAAADSQSGKLEQKEKKSRTAFNDEISDLKEVKEIKESEETKARASGHLAPTSASATVAALLSQGTFSQLTNANGQQRLEAPSKSTNDVTLYSGRR